MTGWCVPIQWDTRNFGDKKAAIETFLQPLFENEQVVFYDKWRDTERGRQAEYQILKFSRKSNKCIHDDFPDALMRVDTKLRGKGKRKKVAMEQIAAFVRPAFVLQKRQR